jgi:cell division protein FtsB
MGGPGGGTGGVGGVGGVGGRSAAQRLNDTADRTEHTGQRSAAVVRWLALIAFILVVAIAGLAVLVQRNSSNVDELQGQLATVQAQVQHLEDFVNELQAPPTTEEQAQDAAISNAVRQVPDIKSILCEAFPQATACNVP